MMLKFKILSLMGLALLIVALAFTLMMKWKHARTIDA
jgi:uncharacterized membrane protein (DUF373 family)